MSTMNEPNQTGQPQADKPFAFCQNCGKPLSRETSRVVGPAVFCEPCLAARLAGAPPIPGNPAGYPPPNPASTTPGGWVASPPALDQPNPGLAALLGFIPGVGAMYNGQYAKGIIHLIVFAVLISLTNVNGIFGLFIAGWIFYMVIEAHHTARARRDGLPLPNPFGLNDIGERLGFGRAWVSGPGVAGMAQDAARTVHQGFSGASASAADAAAQAQTGAPQPGPGAAPWGAPVDASSYTPPYTANYGPYAGGYGQGYSQPYSQPYSGPMPPPIAVEPPFVAPLNRFPTGAVWLIGLGSVFLLSTTGIFNSFAGPTIVGIALIALGIWVFTRRMLETGPSFTNDGTPGYQLRVLRALRLSIWLVLVGLLFLLDAFNLITWHRSWPIFIIAAGVIALLDRTAYSSASTAAYNPVTAPPANPAPPAAATTSAVPPVDTPYPHDSHPEGN